MRGPPQNEAARPPRHGSAEPRASVNSNDPSITTGTGRRKRRNVARNAEPRYPTSTAIKAAMRFLDPRGSR